MGWVAEAGLSGGGWGMGVDVFIWLKGELFNGSTDTFAPCEAQLEPCQNLERI
jgi:hypothetical protein